MIKTKFVTLLVMPRNRRLTLLEQLENCSEVLAVCDCNEARRVLWSRLPVQVVLTDTALPDGDWRSVLDNVLQAEKNAEVIVCTRLADVGLWCDALQRGVYDLLVEPYQWEEVQRIVERAAARSYMRSLSFKVLKSA